MLSFKSPPNPIEIRRASEVISGNTDAGLKVKRFIFVSAAVYFSRRGTCATRNRGPHVLLDTEEGYYLVEIDQHNLPKRAKDCILKHGNLIYSDGTPVTRESRKKEFKKRQKKVKSQHLQT